MRINYFIGLLLSACLFIGCKHTQDQSVPFNNMFLNRSVSPDLDSMHGAKDYLSVYSHIYSITEHKSHDLTATISIRNTSESDSLFIKRADYYNTKGKLIRQYVDHPVFLTPLETVEIVIQERDRTGGSGANFIFEWYSKNNMSDPIFEAVMISTLGQQGLSFTTQSKRFNL